MASFRSMKPFAFWCMTSAAWGLGLAAGCGGGGDGGAGNPNKDAAAADDDDAGADGRIRRMGRIYDAEVKEDGSGVWTNGSDVPQSNAGAITAPSCAGLNANCGQTGGE